MKPRLRIGLWTFQGGCFAAILLGGFFAGWRHSPGIAFLTLLALSFAYVLTLGLRRSPRTWFRFTWLSCSLLLVGLLFEHQDAGIASLFTPLAGLLLCLIVPAGWLLVIGKTVFLALRRSATSEWFRDATVPLRSSLLWTMAICCALLLLHLWPGPVHGAMGHPACAVTLGSMGCVWIWAACDGWSDRPQLSRESGTLGPRPRPMIVGAAFATLLATMALLWFGSLRSAAFSVWNESFESVAAAILAESEDTQVEHRWIGPWYVDEVRADPRGGVYFRTWRGFDFVDTWSYGFAYQPNNSGSPFGACGYWLQPVSADWWVFRANNDWF